jgi:hypothetical protein
MRDGLHERVTPDLRELAVVEVRAIRSEEVRTLARLGSASEQFGGLVEFADFVWYRVFSAGVEAVSSRIWLSEYDPRSRREPRPSWRQAARRAERMLP